MTVPVDERRVCSAVPERTQEQRMEALRKGNAVRLKRASLKRAVKLGQVSARDVLLEPEPYVLTMRVYDLLLSVPAVGKTKAAHMLRMAGASPVKTIGGLSMRQRVELASMVR